MGMSAQTSEHASELMLEQELRDFAYIVSHDLATSFRRIAYFSKKLSNDLNSDGGRCVEHAAAIQQSADKCQDMLQALVAYSRVQGKTLRYAPVSVRGLLQSAKDRLAGAIALSEADVIIALDGGDTDFSIVADAELLIRAFAELISNGVKFGGAVCPPCVLITAGRTATGSCVVRVHDSGFGLDPDYWERAFNIFWQFDPATPGMGAGLALCRRIVRRHGGDVYFEPFDRGACVTIKLPADGIVQ